MVSDQTLTHCTALFMYDRMLRIGQEMTLGNGPRVSVASASLCWLMQLAVL